MKKIILLIALAISSYGYAQDLSVNVSVDMNSYSGTFTSVYVSGTFNSWSGNANIMTDADLDGVWEATLSIPADTIEYKFTLDDWAVQESLVSGSACTVTDGAFTNRELIFDADVTVPVVCWNSCEECSDLEQIDLPIDWEGDLIDYTVTDFGENVSTLIADPLDASNMVLQSIKSATAPGWAGTTLSTPNGLANPIAFDAMNNNITVEVYSPDSGVTVRLKVEDAADVTHTCETDAETTTSGAWETLTFNFSNEASGTAAINYDYTYDKVSIFYNFGVDGATAGSAKTYYCDDLIFGGGEAITENNITFKVDMNTYTEMFTSVYVSGTFNSWSGDANMLTDGDADGIYELTIPLSSDTIEYKFTLDNWAVQEEFVGGESCTVTNDGFTNRELIFDTDMVLTAVCWNSCDECPGLAQIDLPIDWEGDEVDYTTIDFGDNVSVLTADPDDAGNTVLKTDRATTAPTWAGTTLSTNDGLANAIAFSTDYNVITVNVYAPDSGLTIRLKAEDHSNGGISVETDAETTVSNTWETLSFDFSNEATGTAAINYANTYDKLSIFYNFGVDGATAGAQTYYCDSVIFESGASETESNVTFKVDMNNYTDAFTSVYVSGTFNSWSGDANALTDADADGVWETTLLLSNDTIEYKFTIDNWASQEEFVGGETCTVTNDGFTNRELIIESSVTLDAVCWNSCDECPGLAQIDLPIDWEGDLVDYTVTDFGDNTSMLVADPDDASNMVLESTKSATAPTWSGTTLSTPSGLASPIPFDIDNNLITLRVYSAQSGIAVRLKAEDHSDPTHSVETEVLTTTSGEWETLTFDFSNEATGTAAINYTYTFDMLSIFYNFGVDGATAGEQTFYCDDIVFGGEIVETSVDVTFKVDMSEYSGAYTAVNLNGTFNNWCGACAVMADDDMDEVYEITVSLDADEAVEYKFTLDGWTAQENLTEGSSCTVTNDGFTNRSLVPANDTILDVVCWESCTSCEASVPNVDVTFKVDMSEYTEAFTTVNLNGTFNNWCGACAVMTDDDADDVYELTLSLPSADTIEYKFTLDGWTVQEELMEGASCTSTIDGFTNRTMVTANDTILPNVCWNYCVTCLSLDVDDVNWVQDFVISPNPSNGIFMIRGELTSNTNVLINVTDIQGKTVFQSRESSNSISTQVDLSQIENGMYFITVSSEYGRVSDKILLLK